MKVLTSRYTQPEVDDSILLRWCEPSLGVQCQLVGPMVCLGPHKARVYALAE